MYRSLLFVPGARPERFDKAVASGADAVCIDLEDAVPSQKKSQARAAAIDYVSTPRAIPVGVRINTLTSFDGLRDVLFLEESKAAPAFIMMPKIEGAGDVIQLQRLFADKTPPVIALIETPSAAFAVADIARAVGEEGALFFGGADFSAAIGSDMNWDALYGVRAAIVQAAALVGCQTLDVPWLDVPNVDDMVAETKRVKTMGFTGRAVIHPSLVGPVNTVFTPSAEEVAKAEEILSLYDEKTGVILHDGKLVEKPILAAARRVVAQARR